METIIIIVFIVGYLAITMEHNLKIDKLIPALAMMAILWAVIALAHMDVFEVKLLLNIKRITACIRVRELCKPVCNK